MQESQVFCNSSQCQCDDETSDYSVSNASILSSLLQKKADADPEYVTNSQADNPADPTVEDVNNR
jgi:hypothetical protein